MICIDVWWCVIMGVDVYWFVLMCIDVNLCVFMNMAVCYVVLMQYLITPPCIFKNKSTPHNAHFSRLHDNHNLFKGLQYCQHLTSIGWFLGRSMWWWLINHEKETLREGHQFLQTHRHLSETHIVFVFGNSFCLLCFVFNCYVFEYV